MKVYFNLELDNYTNRNGENAIMVRCTYNREHRRVRTNIHIKPKFWDDTIKAVKKNHPLAKEYSASLNEQFLALEKLFLDMVRDDTEISLDAFIKAIGKPKSVNFYEFAYKNKLSQFKSSKKLGTFRRYESVLNKLKEFAGKNLTVKKVDYTLLVDFERYLLDVKKNGRDTVSSNLSVLRSIINEAIKHCVFDKRNPFDSISLKYTDNTKEKLTIEELRVFSTVKLPNIYSLHLARDFFMACFYAAGCRAGDMVMMKWENVKDGKLIYTQQKTDRKLILPLLPELIQVLEKYKSNSSYIFHLLEDKENQSEFAVNSKITYINKYLKEVCKYAGIFKSISTHCARHTFSDISLSLNQNDIFSLKDVLGHSSVKTTEGYLLNRNYSKADEFLRSVSNVLVEKTKNPNEEITSS